MKLTGLSVEFEKMNDGSLYVRNGEYGHIGVYLKADLGAVWVSAADVQSALVSQKGLDEYPDPLEVLQKNRQVVAEREGKDLESRPGAVERVEYACLLLWLRSLTPEAAPRASKLREALEFPRVMEWAYSRTSEMYEEAVASKELLLQQEKSETQTLKTEMSDSRDHCALVRHENATLKKIIKVLADRGDVDSALLDIARLDADDVADTGIDDLIPADEDDDEYDG